MTDEQLFPEPASNHWVPSNHEPHAYYQPLLIIVLPGEHVCLQPDDQVVNAEWDGNICGLTILRRTR